MLKNIFNNYFLIVDKSVWMCYNETKLKYESERGVMFSPNTATDAYKTTHQQQYPNLSRLVSYFTPRKSRVGQTELVSFGQQFYVKHFLINEFNEKFFGVDKATAVKKYARIMKYMLGDRFASTSHWEKLHDLGYLPLRISSIPEGDSVPMKIPMIEITNTHPDFVWLVNYIETSMSCTLWHMMASANVGKEFREIVDYWYGTTVNSDIPRHTAVCDFSMRGQESMESAAKSSAAFLLSFSKTATIPAVEFLEEYYNCNIENELVATALASTEHSVMCSNFAIDGDEKTMVKRLLTEIYPDDNFSMVSDSYDYWRMVTNILADDEIKQAVLNHNGFIAIRPDSGDPADIVCGNIKNVIHAESIKHMIGQADEIAYDYFRKNISDDGYVDYMEVYAEMDGIYYLCKCHADIVSERGGYSDSKYFVLDKVVIDAEQINRTPEHKGTVECLWEIYGGYVNDKGYKVLNDHIRVVYGDSIKPDVANDIYRRLKEKGFAANNVFLGMGSYSLQSCENNTPMTRDTYSIAVKSTYCETPDGKAHAIFKDPKTDTGNFKKSQKGCCIVYRGLDGDYVYEDELTYEENMTTDLIPIFQDGKMLKEYTLAEIRNNLNEGGF